MRVRERKRERWRESERQRQRDCKSGERDREKVWGMIDAALNSIV